MKKLYYLCAVFAFSFQAFAQPANDNCSGAVSLTVNTTGDCATLVAGSLVGATDSGAGDHGAGVPSDDVWYTFVATNTTQVIKLLNVAGTPTDLVHEILTGGCDDLTTFYIGDDPDTSSVSGFVVGDTYYLRVFSYQADPATSTTFDVCVSGPPAPPANDNCDAAVALTVNADSLCGTVVAGTLAGATDSGEGDNGDGTPNDDVWYTFVATASSQKISLLNVEGSPSDLMIEVLTGSCGDLTSFALSDPESTLVTELTEGDTYYLRIFSYQNAPALSTTFDLCIGLPPTPPANDNCDAAVVITPNANLACTNVIAGTLAGATDSGEGESEVGNSDDDVWYTFIATATTHVISLLNVEGDQTDLVHEVMTGSCGGDLESVNASDSNTSVVGGLVVGDTYFVRVYSYYSTAPESTTFNICIGTAPELDNDECSDAIALTVNPDFNCASVVSGSLSGATDSNEGDNGAGNPNDDVWYTFVATNAAHRITLSNISGNVTDLVHEVLDGTCGNFTSLNISDPNTSNISGLTVGNTYYVRVFSYSETPSTSTLFNICIGTPPPAPANDDCSGAIALIPAGNYATGAIEGSDTGGATDSGATSTIPASSCSTFSYGGGDIWYSVTIPESGNLTVETGPSGTETFDSVVAAYAGTCDEFTAISCSDDASGISPYSRLTFTGRTAGEVIYLRVYEYGNDNVAPFMISAYDSSLLATTSFDSTGFSAYPNPVKDVLNLSYTKNISDVQVFNLMGQQVSAVNVQNRESKVDMSNLPTGTYIVKVTSEGQIKTIKVIKQ